MTRGDVWRFRVRQLAFPGAEGYGRFARGGRGGRVIKVTNLDDAGPGSLRAAIEAEGPRTVVFDVSGRIDLKNRLAIRNPYLTIAALLTAGLDGLKNETDPGPPQEGNTYDLLQEGVELERVPESLGAALEALAADKHITDNAMPGRLYKVFQHYKRDEWERYLAAVTDWERERYLELLP